MTKRKRHGRRFRKNLPEHPTKEQLAERYAKAADPNTDIGEMPGLLFMCPRHALQNPALTLMQFSQPELTIDVTRARFEIARRDIAVAGQAMTSRERVALLEAVVDAARPIVRKWDLECEPTPEEIDALDDAVKALPSREP